MVDNSPSEPKKYTGQAMDRQYRGENADVTYSLKRCIHAEECIHRLSQVFDTAKRPWINANGTSPEALSTVVTHCPSGALHVTRNDGVAEAVPATNTVRLWRDGPLQFNGDLSIDGATVEVRHETRATLCRCGESHNKPFCDNTHRDTGFRADDPEPPADPVQVMAEGAHPLVITAEPNGPYLINGEVVIRNAADRVIYVGSDTALCRCGHSDHKPFCDGTHEMIGFRAD